MDALLTSPPRVLDSNLTQLPHPSVLRAVFQLTMHKEKVAPQTTGAIWHAFGAHLGRFLANPQLDPVAHHAFFLQVLRIFDARYNKINSWKEITAPLVFWMCSLPCTTTLPDTSRSPSPSTDSSSSHTTSQSQLSPDPKPRSSPAIQESDLEHTPAMTSSLAPQLERLLLIANALLKMQQAYASQIGAQLLAKLLSPSQNLISPLLALVAPPLDRDAERFVMSLDEHKTLGMLSSILTLPTSQRISEWAGLLIIRYRHLVCRCSPDRKQFLHSYTKWSTLVEKALSVIVTNLFLKPFRHGAVTLLCTLLLSIQHTARYFHSCLPKIYGALRLYCDELERLEVHAGSNQTKSAVPTVHAIFSFLKLQDMTNPLKSEVELEALPHSITSGMYNDDEYSLRNSISSLSTLLLAEMTLYTGYPESYIPVYKLLSQRIYCIGEKTSTALQRPFSAPSENSLKDILIRESWRYDPLQSISAQGRRSGATAAEGFWQTPSSMDVDDGSLEEYEMSEYGVAADDGFTNRVNSGEPGAKRGIMNLGNLCYMNCVIQVLFHTTAFRNAIFDPWRHVLAIGPPSPTPPSSRYSDKSPTLSTKTMTDADNNFNQEGYVSTSSSDAINSNGEQTQMIDPRSHTPPNGDLSMGVTLRLAQYSHLTDAKLPKLIEEIQFIFASLLHSRRLAISPKPLFGALPDWIRPGAQQDATEFEKAFFGALDAEWRPSLPSSQTPSTDPSSNFQQPTFAQITTPSNIANHNSIKFATNNIPTPVSQIFGGTTCTSIRCVECGHVSERLEEILDLSLNFPPAPSTGREGKSEALPLDTSSEHTYSIEELLEHFMEMETLKNDNQYQCSHCQKLVDAKRLVRVVTPPEHLAIHLGRFHYDYRTQTRSKVMSKLKVPEKFELPIIADGLIVSSSMGNMDALAQSTSPSNMDVDHNDPTQDAQRWEKAFELSGVKYALYGCVMHSGSSTEYGHYYTYARDSSAVFENSESAMDALHQDGRESPTVDSNWYCLNDEIVTVTSFQSFTNIEKYCKNDVPYILYYKRVDPRFPPSSFTKDATVPEQARKRVSTDNAVAASSRNRRSAAMRPSRQALLNTRIDFNSRYGPGPDSDGHGFGGRWIS